MSADKIAFLQNGFIPVVKEIPSDTRPLWGKMSLQQMIEHLSDAFRVASGRNLQPTIFTPEENIPRMQAFLLSDKPFKENTPNPLMPETPAPVRNKDKEEAIKELEEEVTHFFHVFTANDKLITRNPFFGDLDFNLNLHLLHKHALHHLRQFGVTV